MDNDIIGKLIKLIEPVIIKLGFELYHIEFIKEDNENYLRIYIDSSKGISLSDCEKVSRPISDLLDEADLIDESYYLEVSSPGVFRTLHNDVHLAKYVDYDIIITLNSPLEGITELKGTLSGFTDSTVEIMNNDKINSIPKNKIKIITLNGEL